MAREIPDDAEDDNSAQEEESDDKSIEVDIVSSAESSNEIDMKIITNVPNIFFFTFLIGYRVLISKNILSRK